MKIITIKEAHILLSKASSLEYFGASCRSFELFNLDDECKLDDLFLIVNWKKDSDKFFIADNLDVEIASNHLILTNLLGTKMPFALLSEMNIEDELKNKSGS